MCKRLTLRFWVISFNESDVCNTYKSVSAVWRDNPRGSGDGMRTGGLWDGVGIPYFCKGVAFCFYIIFFGTADAAVTVAAEDRNCVNASPSTPQPTHTHTLTLSILHIRIYIHTRIYKCLCAFVYLCIRACVCVRTTVPPRNYESRGKWAMAAVWEHIH